MIEARALLADLRTKRAAIDRLIVNLVAVYGDDGPVPAAETPADASPTSWRHTTPATERYAAAHPPGTLPTPVPGPRPPHKKPRTLADVVTPTPELRAHDVPDARRQAILALLKTGPKATREIAADLKIDRRLGKMVLQRMKKVGLVVSTGTTNGQRWALPAGGPVPVTAPAPPPHIEPQKTTHRTPPADDSAWVATRDATVLQRIQAHEGVATFAELWRWFISSAVAGVGDEAKKHDNLQNALLRLKAKGAIGRTGSTWSLVGAGAARA